MDKYADWIGRSETRADVVTAGPLQRLAALLDYDTPPWADVPPLGHWLFTLPDARQSELGADGHPDRGGLIPVMPAPRRMWAGSRLTFAAPLTIGDSIKRRSSIAAVAAKGAMTFVTLRHEISAADQVAIIEEQDLVYLPARTADESATPPKSVDVPEAKSSRTLSADDALLFRFSAVTFNAHRIHYDRAYARSVEHYPGLVVHGPLLATLLIDHVLREDPRDKITAFEFRARAPVFDGEAFTLNRNGPDLWVRRADGGIAMTAKVTLA